MLLQSFLVNKSIVSSDNAVGYRNALLERENASNYCNTNFLEDAFSCELDAAAIMDVFCCCGGLCLEFVERDEVLLVVGGSGLCSVKYFWDGGFEGVEVESRGRAAGKRKG